MLLYTGLGLLIAGLLLVLMPNKLISDPAKAEAMRKQAPILAAVGAVLLFLRFMILS